jgi:hypothetical protein
MKSIRANPVAASAARIGDDDRVPLLTVTGALGDSVSESRRGRRSDRRTGDVGDAMRRTLRNNAFGLKDRLGRGAYLLEPNKETIYSDGIPPHR